MSYALYPPNPTAASTELKGSFGAGGGCANCWQWSYTFVTRGDAVISLSLYDDQSCCFNGMQPVTIVGSRSNLFLLPPGRTGGLNAAVALGELTAPGALAPSGLPPPAGSRLRTQPC